MLSFICSIIGSIVYSLYLFILLFYSLKLKITLCFHLLGFLQICHLFSYFSLPLSSIFHVVIALSPELSILLQIEWFFSRVCRAALILELSFTVILGILFSFFFSDWVSYFKDFILSLFLVYSLALRDHILQLFHLIEGMSGDLLMISCEMSAS